MEKVLTMEAIMEANRIEYAKQKEVFLQECEDAYNTGIYSHIDFIEQNHDDKLLKVFTEFHEKNMTVDEQRSYLIQNGYDLNKMRTLYRVCIKAIKDAFHANEYRGGWLPFYFLGGDDGHDDAFKLDRNIMSISYHRY